MPEPLEGQQVASGPAAEIQNDEWRRRLDGLEQRVDGQPQARAMATASAAPTDEIMPSPEASGSPQVASAGEGASPAPQPTSKKDESPASNRKKKKAERKQQKQEQKKKKNDPPDAIKNGLTESDRLALGKLITSEISSGHKGEELSAPLKKELERLRAERVKASSQATQPKKKKKKTA